MGVDLRGVEIDAIIAIGSPRYSTEQRGEDNEGEKTGKGDFAGAKTNLALVFHDVTVIDRCANIFFSWGQAKKGNKNL